MINTVEWLRAQPDGIEVSWWCDDLDEGQQWVDGWVDVRCDAIQAVTGDNWVWTITMGDPGSIRWPADMAVLLADDGAGDPWAYDAAVPLIDGLPDPVGWQQAAEGGPKGATWRGAPAWSPTAVSAAIEAWCAGYGRKAHAVWDPHHAPSVWRRRAEAIAVAVDQGIEPRYLIAPGGDGKAAVYATDQALEMFLALEFDDEA